MLDQIHIRNANSSDLDTLVGFNLALGQETEDKELLPQALYAGVKALLQSPQYGFYLIAEVEGEPAGCLMITTEWSDWRNGMFWWVQSVYVVPQFRGRGIYRALYSKVKELAQQDGNNKVCGFRLYVMSNNIPAQEVYKRVGMKPTPYIILEEML